MRLTTWTEPKTENPADFTLAARSLLREAERALEGRARELCLTAIAACADLAEELQDDADAALRRWAIDHNELGKDPE